MTSALDGEVSVTPRPPLPPEKTRYPLYRRLCGPQGRSGRVRKISPPPGFDPRTVQPVASRYTDCAIPGLIRAVLIIKYDRSRDASMDKYFCSPFRNQGYKRQTATQHRIESQPLTGRNIRLKALLLIQVIGWQHK